MLRRGSELKVDCEAVNHTMFRYEYVAAVCAAEVRQSQLLVAMLRKCGRVESWLGSTAVRSYDKREFFLLMLSDF